MIAYVKKTVKRARQLFLPIHVKVWLGAVRI